MQPFDLRLALASDVGAMHEFLMEHGTNEWNYLPADGVAAEFRDIADGRAFAVLAEHDQLLMGFAIVYPNMIRFPDFTSPALPASSVGYIAEVVVHKNYAGKGVGAALLEEVKVVLLRLGMTEVNIDCHEENKASRGMMRKAGFEELALFPDHDRRTTGTRNTWVGRLVLSKS